MGTFEYDAEKIYSRFFVDDTLCLCHYLSKNTGKRMIVVRFDYFPWSMYLKIETHLINEGFFYFAERDGKAWYST